MKLKKISVVDHCKWWILRHELSEEEIKELGKAARKQPKTGFGLQATCPDLFNRGK